MSKPEWGTKRRCAACEASFYDMRSDPIRCPKCGVVHRVDAVAASRRAGPRAARSWTSKATVKAAPAVAVAAVADERDDEDDTEEEDDLVADEGDEVEPDAEGEEDPERPARSDD
jgi:uncharacterized protein (TIGR02300 family)